MKRKALLILAVGVALGGSSIPAFAQNAQPPDLPRGDAAGIVGWQNVNKSELSAEFRNDWYNRAAYGGVVAGWYWTDHLKTEVEAGASSKVRFQTYRTFPVDNFFGSGTSQYTFSTRRLAIAQQYQFFRNAWFHPHLAAGADLNWETSTERSDPIIVYGPPSGAPRTIRPAQVRGPDTRLRVRPFGEVGFKSYVTPRAFIRTDVRVFADKGIDEVQVRFGMGFDF
jgi:hypothetical protein